MAISTALAPAPAAPLDTAILADPIEFIRFEHYRQRTLCDRLGRVADDLNRPGAGGDAAWILDYLSTDLPLHIADESQDLMPLLRERCQADGQVHAICDTLDREHERDERGRDRLLEGLRRLAARRPVADPDHFVSAARAFQDKLRRHVVWENQMLLPLARKILWTGDLESLGLRMARRHGFSGRA
ncbi:MAG TPA: hemerythrin domain-containing protein [Alphaproteobacteria bacterium]|jgi:hemerythrin-like domain-containing protein|nr:hemerythrin domain-containing protein [Alphaproteobacteria bacterium]